MNFLSTKLDIKLAIKILGLILPALILYMILYLSANFFISYLNWWIIAFLVSLIIGILLSKILNFLKINKKSKLLAVISTLLVGFVIILTDASIEHNYAMWDVCYPAIYARLGVKMGQAIPPGKDPLGKDGVYRSWYQHLECENNILPWPWGKKAKFSDNPPGFIPK